jgi:hypothetical protein
MKTRTSTLLQLGPPPVLSTESLQAYNELMSRYEQNFDPMHAYEAVLVRDATDATFESVRYGRAKVMLIENKVRALRELEAKRRQAEAEKKAVLAKSVAAKYSAPATEPEEAVDRLVEEVDAILLEPARELEQARAFQAVLGEYDCLDRLQMRAIARRDNAIAQIERYRDGMGGRIHRMIDEIAAQAGDEAPQQVREAPAATDVQQAAAHPQNLEAVTDAPDVQPGGVENEAAPAEASTVADAPNLQPAEPEQAREAPTAAQVQPQ